MTMTEVDFEDVGVALVMGTVVFGTIGLALILTVLLASFLWNLHPVLPAVAVGVWIASVFTIYWDLKR